MYDDLRLMSSGAGLLQAQRHVISMTHTMLDVSCSVQIWLQHLPWLWINQSGGKKWKNKIPLKSCISPTCGQDVVMHRHIKPFLNQHMILSHERIIGYTSAEIIQFSSCRWICLADLCPMWEHKVWPQDPRKPLHITAINLSLPQRRSHLHGDIMFPSNSCLKHNICNDELWNLLPVKPWSWKINKGVKYWPR